MLVLRLFLEIEDARGKHSPAMYRYSTRICCSYAFSTADPSLSLRHGCESLEVLKSSKRDLFASHSSSAIFG